MRGRALGNGVLRTRLREDGTRIHVGDYRDSRGRRKRVVLGSDLRVATRRLAELVRKRDLVLGGLQVEGLEDTSIEDLLRTYGDHQLGRCKPQTVETTRSMVRRIAGELRAELVREVEAEAYLAYRRRRLLSGRAPATLNREYAAISGMMRWGLRSRLISRNPLEHIGLLREHPKTRRALSDEEVRRFLLAARHVDHEMAQRKAAKQTISGATKGPGYAAVPRAPRIPQASLWLSLIETGARFGELTSCSWSDLDHEQLKLRLRAEHTKSLRERWIPLRPKHVEELLRLRPLHREYLGALPTAGDPIFRTPVGVPWKDHVRNALRAFHRVLAMAGIDREDEEGRRVNIHALRHTFATRLARSGVGLVEAQKLLGHSDPKLTARVYTHLEVDQLRDAIAKLPEPESDPRDRVRVPMPVYVVPNGPRVRPEGQVLTLAHTGPAM